MQFTNPTEDAVSSTDIDFTLFAKAAKTMVNIPKCVFLNSTPFFHTTAADCIIIELAGHVSSSIWREGVLVNYNAFDSLRA